MKTRKTRADRRFTRLLIATMILSVLALITMVVAFSSDSFHFRNHKPTNEMPDLIGLTEKEAIDAIKAAGGNAAVSYAHNSVQKGVVIEQGVKKVIILDGRVPHATLMEILTNEGAGTMFKRG